MKRFRPIVTLLCLCALAVSATAQKGSDKYREQAEAIRKQIWAWDKPEFKQKSVPAEYQNASKVIIARHLDVNADTKKKFAGLGTYRELMITEILRESIKLNDKSAVSDYSEISYTQLEKKSGGLMDHTTIVYVGIRIIKPDGTVKEIDADDIVLTTDLKKQKEAKIAVPDIQPGDIIDYFVAKQTNMSQVESIPPYLFLLYDDAPILHCSMHFAVGKKYSIEYRSYNGAPDFKVSRNEDQDNILDLTASNIPPVTENNLWTAPYLQLPMIRLNILLGENALIADKAHRRGEVYKNQDAGEYLDARLGTIAYMRTTVRLNFKMGKVVDDYLRTIRRNRNNMTDDSLAREYFYVFRFHTFLEQTEEKEISKILEMPAMNLNEDLVTYYLGEFLKYEDIDNSMVYATSNRGPRMNEVLSTSDLNSIIMIRSQAAPFYGFSTIFTTPAYLPFYFENTKKAIAVNTGSSNVVRRFDKRTIDIPGSGPGDNVRTENLEVALSSEPSFLSIKRKTTLTGHYKSDEQQRLILFEDYYNSERKYFNDGKSLIERLSDRRKTRQFSEELESAFAEARKKNRESFLEEIRSNYDEEIKDMSNYKVENLGVRHTSPDFVYSSEFKMGGLVKKAGSSLIIDIGKLQGAQLKLENNQRKRSLDMYAPFARSLQYEIRFAIPEGYRAEGVEALNKKVENSAGLFSCEAKTDGKTISLKIRKSYNHSFEPVSNWDMMIAFIDAANSWGNSKIVLKKM